jgi:uncharacterized protein (DUF433 family)
MGAALSEEGGQDNMISAQRPAHREQRKHSRSGQAESAQGGSMNKEYVIQVNGAYRIADSRVSLDSVVYAWLEGQSPETIADNFSVLTLEEVYGAIAFYLSNRETIDEYLREKKAEFEEMRRKSVEELRKNRPQLYAKLMAAKQRRAATETEPELTPQ